MLKKKSLREERYDWHAVGCTRSYFSRVSSLRHVALSFQLQQDAFHRREEGLRKKDLELQESLIKFNKFLQVSTAQSGDAIRKCLLVLYCTRVHVVRKMSRSAIAL